MGLSVSSGVKCSGCLYGVTSFTERRREGGRGYSFNFFSSVFGSSGPSSLGCASIASFGGEVVSINDFLLVFYGLEMTALALERRLAV